MKMRDFLPQVLSWCLAAYFMLELWDFLFRSQVDAWDYPNWLNYLIALFEMAAAVMMQRNAMRPFGALISAIAMAAVSMTALVHGDYFHSFTSTIGFTVSSAIAVTINEPPA